MQGNGSRGIKAPPSVEEGQPIPVEVAVPGVDHILVTGGQPGERPTKVPLGPNGKASIPPRPQWPAGTLLFVFTNTAPVRAVLIEIIPGQS